MYTLPTGYSTGSPSDTAITGWLWDFLTWADEVVDLQFRCDTQCTPGDYGQYSFDVDATWFPNASYLAYTNAAYWIGQSHRAIGNLSEGRHQGRVSGRVNTSGNTLSLANLSSTGLVRG